MSFAPISDILWRERHLLDRLEERIAESGIESLVDPEGHARQEAELIALELQRAELDRAVVAHEVAQQLGLGDAPTLDQLATVVPSPWGLIFAAHRDALQDRVRRVADPFVPQSLRETLA